MNDTAKQVLDKLLKQFEAHFGQKPAVCAHAPGRIEVLGNHTDYNEGLVLSAAIDRGTFFVAAPSEDTTCRLVAGDLMKEVTFPVNDPQPGKTDTWANYVKGVLAGLSPKGAIENGFIGMFLGNIPLGSGLSSSAALEISSGLALCKLYGVAVGNLELAKIGQKAEHDYAGANCGLLDQISSLFGKANHLVLSDFRSLSIKTIPVSPDTCFLMCDTRTHHALVDGAYNERRQHCEDAAAFFADKLDHPVSALRDVSPEELETHRTEMDEKKARRASHPITENDRVLRGLDILENNDLEAFGKLMFESHESSKRDFENSCPELDTIVSTARNIPAVLGARLSGGGFGGSAVLLIHPRDAEVVSHAIAAAFKKAHGHTCDVRVIIPSDGATIIQ